MTGSHISLFSGVGMTDLAAESAGFKTISTAEIDPFCRSILERRFPDALPHNDVREVTVGSVPPALRPLLVSGGFPCQDISAAGNGAGIKGSRSGLWTEFARVIHEFRPEHVLIENSALLRSRGLDRVLCDLADLGYEARWDCIPAAAVGAPHLRDRVFILAWPGTLPEDIFTDPQAQPGYLGYAVTVGCFAGSSGERLTRFPRAGRLDGGGRIWESTPSAPIREAKKGCLRAASTLQDFPQRTVPTPTAGDSKATTNATTINPVSTTRHSGRTLTDYVRLFPTPRAAPNDWRTTRNAPTHGKGHGKTLAGELNDLERAAGRVPAPSSESAGNVNPAWVEWLMGLPQGWTDPGVDNDALVPHHGWGTEPDVPRTVANPPHRRDRLRALGNGLVPQAAQVALGWINER